MIGTKEKFLKGNAVHKAAGLAALIATFAVLVMAFGVRAPEEGFSFQPTYPPQPPSDFMRPVEEYPKLVLRFYAADSLFVLSYVMVFVGMHAVALHRSRTFAWVGLGSGLFVGLFDMAENAFFIAYALL